MAAVAEILPPEGRKPFAQAIEPLIIDERGSAFVPNPFIARCDDLAFVRQGMCLAWWPLPEFQAVVLAIYGGNHSAPSNDSVVTAISREGIEALIADLQSIHDQLEPVD